MSLNFVAKSIQTSTNDGTYEETPVESQDGQTEVTVNASGVGLFEQLRKNKDKQEEERLEFQQSIMRGTLTLDEDDAAHLEYLNRQKTEQLSKLQEQTQSEVAAFRAAQMEQKLGGDDKSKETKESISLGATVKSEASPSFTAPIIKKRKRKADTADSKPSADPKQPKPDTPDTTSPVTKEPADEKSAGISTLLAGYDSSSSEED